MTIEKLHAKMSKEEEELLGATVPKSVSKYLRAQKPRSKAGPSVKIGGLPLQLDDAMPILLKDNRAGDEPHAILWSPSASASAANGDVRHLISSDSDSESGVLQPKFKREPQQHRGGGLLPIPNKVQQRV